MRGDARDHVEEGGDGGRREVRDDLVGPTCHRCIERERGVVGCCLELDSGCVALGFWWMLAQDKC